MSNPEKYFMNQLKSHYCQLPPSDDLEYVKKVKKLKNYFLVSEKNLKSYLIMKSLPAIYYEKRRQIRTSRFTIIHPLSEFLRSWRFWMCFVLLSSVILFPFASAFHGPLYAKCLIEAKQSFFSFYGILVAVFLFQVFCLVDIVVNFLTGYTNSSTDEMVIQPSRIAKRYLCTYFFPDLISSLPVEVATIVIGGLDAYVRFTTIEHAIFSLLPLFKLARVVTLYEYFHDIYGYFSYSYSVYKMVAAIVFYLLIAHWTACLNILVPHIIFYKDLLDCRVKPCKTCWLVKKNIVRKDLFSQYVASAYRALTCLTGIGCDVKKLKNTEEKIIFVLIGFVGQIYWLILLVIFLQMFATIRLGRMRYLDMMNQVNEYMSQRKFPPDLRRKIRQYYVYMFQNEYVGEKGILGLVSENLQKEIVLRMHRSLVEKVQMFAGLNQNLVFKIIASLKPVIYLKNDVIFRVRERGRCMYFISYGTIAMYTESGKEICHLEDGDYFGEISLILLTRRSTTAIALEPTELYRLDAKEFLEVITPESSVFSKMEKIAVERYKKSHDLLFDQDENLEQWKKTIKDSEPELNEDEDSECFEDEKPDEIHH